MFLKALFKFNKIYFFVSLILLSAFLFINFKWGMVVSPISHYGMYSGVYKTQTEKTIYTHIINGKKLDPQQLTIIQNDFLQSFPAIYQTESGINNAVFNTMFPYLNKVGLASQNDSAKFTNHFSKGKFKNWYAEKLANITQHKIDSFRILQQQYIWQNDQFKPVGEISLINLY